MNAMIKEITLAQFQEMLDTTTDQQVLKEFAEKSKGMDKVTISTDTTFGTVLVYHKDTNECPIIFKAEEKYFVFNPDAEDFRTRESFFGDATSETEIAIGTFDIVDINIPEYRKITVDDILRLPSIRDKSDEISYSLVQTLLGGDYISNYQETVKDVSYLIVMEKEGDENGKYWESVGVMYYRGFPVAIVEQSGKWSDSYKVTAVSPRYADMVLYMRSIFAPEDNQFAGEGDEISFSKNLEGIFYNL